MERAETLPESERETTRVQFEMPARSMERLRLLKDRTEATSYAEVVRNALRFYEFLVSEAEKGSEVYVEPKDGSGKKTVLVHQ